MTTTAGIERVHQELQKLVGLELTVASRAADMLDLGFGPLVPVVSRHGRDKGETRLVAEVALHVQCPWRVEGPDGLVTGRGDVWEPVEPLTGEAFVAWDWERDGNLQDRRMAEWLGIPDLPRYDPRAFISTRRPAVLAARATPFEGAEIDLADGYRLVLFPHDSRGESWRMFREDRDSDDDSPHFVCGGGRFGEDFD